MDLVVPSEDSCTPQNDYIKPFGGLMVPSERCTVGLEAALEKLNLEEEWKAGTWLPPASSSDTTHRAASLPERDATTSLRESISSCCLPSRHCGQ